MQIGRVIPLAGWVCGVFGELVERRGSAGVHPATRPPCEAIIRGRIAGMVAAMRGRGDEWYV